MTNAVVAPTSEQRDTASTGMKKNLGDARGRLGLDKAKPLFCSERNEALLVERDMQWQADQKEAEMPASLAQRPTGRCLGALLGMRPALAA